MNDRAAWTSALLGIAPRRHKYGARPAVVGARRFDSTREARRYQELELLVRAGAIDGLECQPAFPLHVVELYRSIPPIQVRTVGTYHGDFRYRDLKTGEIVVEDVKSRPTRTEAYCLRKRIAEAVHGITIREV